MVLMHIFFVALLSNHPSCGKYPSKTADFFATVPKMRGDFGMKDVFPKNKNQMSLMVGGYLDNTPLPIIYI